MTEGRITRADLDWWLEFAAGRVWTFAKTYASSAPHHYVVQDKSPGVSHQDVVRAARVISTFGVPGKYYALTKIYLTSPDGAVRWWTEDRHFLDATLINRATTERKYGIQNAPVTASGIDTPYDEVATIWDVDHPIGSDEADNLERLLSGCRGKYPPHVLDIGCGTGRFLDLGVVPPGRCAAIDCSQAMLNVLIRKHPMAAAVYAMDVREALASGCFTPGQFDWVVLDAEVELTERQRGQAEALARLAMITTQAGEWTVQAVGDVSQDRLVSGAAT